MEENRVFFVSSSLPPWPAKSAVVERSSIIDGLYRCRRKRKRSARIAYARSSLLHIHILCTRNRNAPFRKKKRAKTDVASPRNTRGIRFLRVSVSMFPGMAGRVITMHQDGNYSNAHRKYIVVLERIARMRDLCRAILFRVITRRRS